MDMDACSQTNAFARAPRVRDERQLTSRVAAPVAAHHEQEKRLQPPAPASHDLAILAWRVALRLSGQRESILP